MRRPIIPPTLLTIAIPTPFRIIATRTGATVIKENDSPLWSSSKVVSIDAKTSIMKIKFNDTIESNEPEWFVNYE